MSVARLPMHRVLAAASLAVLGCSSLQASAAKPELIDIQVLAINDFHGNIAEPSGSSGRVGTVNAGGAEFLSTHIAQLREANPDRSFVVSAGDLIGASPLLSGLFHDEPTIEAMNRIGLDFNAVGNHEFDEGVAELVRMQEGGCHPVDGCLDGDGFEGADFRFLSANVERTRDGKSLFPRYALAARGARRREGCVHRPDPGRHADHRGPRRDRGLVLPR